MMKSGGTPATALDTSRSFATSAALSVDNKCSPNVVGSEWITTDADAGAVGKLRHSPFESGVVGLRRSMDALTCQPFAGDGGRYWVVLQSPFGLTGIRLDNTTDTPADLCILSVTYAGEDARNIAPAGTVPENVVPANTSEPSTWLDDTASG
jgi:hypothetical protein